MTHAEILTKAIDKAVANGWEVGKQVRYTENYGWNQYSGGELEVTESGVAGSVMQLLGESDIIYNHDFAKALWGDTYESLPEALPRTPDGKLYTATWQHHLQQMVIAPDPIEYLGEHLEASHE